MSTGIRARGDLKRAALHAAVYARELLIERQVAGEVYRLLFFDGQLLDTVLRRPPTLVGDGHSTIRQLITRENVLRTRQRDYAQTLINVDVDMQRTLAWANQSLSSVPGDGVAIAVKTVTNDNTSRDNHAANGVLTEEILEAARQAMAVVGVRLAGVDIITPDPTRSLQASGGVILELNARPGYHYHYHRQPLGAAVAIPILARLLLIEGQLVAPPVSYDVSG